MPITTGSLTQRLGQFLTDIGGFFADVVAIKALLEQLMSPTAIAGKLTLLNLQTQIDLIRGSGQGTRANLYQLFTMLSDNLELLNNSVGATPSDPNLRQALRYLTQSGDGTALNRNLDSVVNQIFDLQGARPDNKTLYDLWLTLQSPSGPRLQTIIEKLDVLLDEKMGDTASPLTMLGLTALIQECICSIDDKTPPLEPPPPTPGLVPQESLCAAGLPLLWELKPSDWRQDGQGVWYAAPLAIFAAGIGYTLEDFDAGVAEGIAELVVADKDNGARLLECGVAVSLETGSLEAITRGGYEITSRNPDEAVSSGLNSTATNIFNTSSGCKNIQLISVEGVNDAMRFTGVLRSGASFPPLETIWFYELPPN